MALSLLFLLPSSATNSSSYGLPHSHLSLALSSPSPSKRPSSSTPEQQAKSSEHVNSTAAVVAKKMKVDFQLDERREEEEGPEEEGSEQQREMEELARECERDEEGMSAASMTGGKAVR